MLRFLVPFLKNYQMKYFLIKYLRLVVFIAVQTFWLFHTNDLFAQEKIKAEEHKEGIIENLFGPGDEEFVCYNRVHRNFYTGIFVLVVALGIAIYARYRVKKSMAINLELKNTIIEEKNRNITDSITYAKHLQEAILPPRKRIEELFPESFILYKPKDIVAGDFYWIENCDDLFFIAAADCTGHGVPGAMVSVVCNNALNRVVKEYKITDPGKILDMTRELVVETFGKSKGEIKDGMDISLCCIDTKTGILKWAGANNPLWYVQNGELKELAPDRQPVGKTENMLSFTTHEIKLNKNDCAYLFTDGYADQFGGTKGKKYLNKNFKQTVISVHSKSMNKQETELNAVIDNWRGNLEQVDDILIIGIRMS